MNDQSFQPGQRVTVINRTLGGKYVVEGEALIVHHLEDNRYMVQFESGRKYERFVDPAAQDDPEGYCEILNERITGHDGGEKH